MLTAPFPRGVRGNVLAGSCSPGRPSSRRWAVRPLVWRWQPPPAVLAAATGGPGGQDNGKLPSDGSLKNTSREAMLAKLEAAKKYKQAQGGTFNMTSVPPEQPPPPPFPVPKAQELGLDALQEDGEISDTVAKFLASNEDSRARQETDFLSALQEASKASTSTEAVDANQELYRSRAQKADVKALQSSTSLYTDKPKPVNDGENSSSSGNSDLAASFLRATLKQQQDRKDGKASAIEEGQRMEDYLLKKEQKGRQEKVEFITVEKNYKPKVSTWGMFPRPENISKAYGGGRTINPGDAIESEEDKKAREASVRERVMAYKVSQGLVIDETTNAKCEALYMTGMAKMKEGRLAEAAEVFAEVQELVVLRSSWGGRARLQRALCLDSLARTKEAQALYKQITNHPEAAVAKQAKQMMFGINSMDYLKTHTISYNVGREDYEGYFRRIRSDWDTMYSGQMEEEEDSLRWQSAVAVAVMVSPVVGVATMILSKC
mmetsp:Transcript_9630/g.27560  ORF Transcript_9630/g.27560 Transcript_9630/m.27560 type:complete len:490 (+) Transcript_9630:325-1794(+)